MSALLRAQDYWGMMGFRDQRVILLLVKADDFVVKKTPQLFPAEVVLHEIKLKKR